ncbi:hypothetical protein K7R09_24170 [Serratia ureilytica]|uniref:Contractile injection system tape measure protein n=2 Tax=Serratia ureilytica TaxID=300181 RepID=A0ABU0VR06_9GAMM|nr:contractile injection system tape measure protein [Serratia ureilytica]MCU7064901.1 hypothetical protein [Serratia ureilytica]MDQ1811419.1 contractile injection system tape measure protein [Serratia ureilytica]MDQ1840376.1 contractile injection system tape measure protein [Serratia ureilytica]MDQ1863864.1 contractile injection system tape measure protein [Serratia ureilytica]
MNNASVGRLRLRLHTQGRHAQTLQQRCSMWCHAELRDLLARVITAETPGQKVGCLDRLTLRLGDIPLSRFEEVMGERVVFCLGKELQGLSWGNDANRVLAVSPPSGGDAVAAGGALLREDAEEGLTKAAASNAPLDQGPAVGFYQLLHYLETGRVAVARQWSTRVARDTWLQETLLQARLVQATAAGRPLRVALAQCLLSPQAYQRLVTTWSGELVAAVCVWLSPLHHLPAPIVAESGAAVVPAALLALQHHAAVASHSSSNDAVHSAGWTTVRPATGVQAAAGSVVSWVAELLQTPLPPHLHRALRAWRQNYPLLWDALPTAAREAAKRVSQAEPNVLQNAQQAASPMNTVAPPVFAKAVQVSPGAVSDTWEVTNAGLVLLWPLLPTLFTTFGWVNEGKFVDDDARSQAVAALDWLVWGDTDIAAWRTPCACLLCGIDLDTPLEVVSPAVEAQLALDAWLTDSLRAMPRMARGGLALLRTLFLQRPGTLTMAQNVRLLVDPAAPDVLLHDLPWPLTPVVLPWLQTLITVEWNV